MPVSLPASGPSQFSQMVVAPWSIIANQDGAVSWNSRV